MRRQSREFALQILFQTEFASQISTSLLLDVIGADADTETLEYAQVLIDGVNANKENIDVLIQNSSQHWKLNRMATVDRNILRIATFEMKFSVDPLKSNVVIDEAIEIAKKFGTTESASFINGVLDQIGKS